MSRTGRPLPVSGFTLIELLVVMALAGLMLTLVPPLLDRGSDRARLVHDHDRLINRLRLARSEAIAGDRPVTLQIDPAQHSYGTRGLDQRLQPGTEIAMEGSLAGAIRFFPDGSASGGRIALVNPSGRLALQIDWLTGAIEAIP